MFHSGATIRFANETEVILEPRAYLGFSRKSYFDFHGKRYKWNGLKTLEDEDGQVVAKFERKYFTIRLDGRLEVFEAGEHMMDIIAATCVMILYRYHDEERRWPS